MKPINQEMNPSIDLLQERTNELTVKLQTITEENENTQATYNRLLGTHLVNQHTLGQYKAQRVQNNTKMKELLQKNMKIELDNLKLKTYLETESKNHFQNSKDGTCDDTCLENSILQHRIKEVKNNVETLENLIIDFQKRINSLTMQINDIQIAREFRLEQINSRIAPIFNTSQSQ